MDFKVNHNKCTQCKICVSECPVLIINAKTEYPTIKDGKEKNCIKCQHCLAVCPEGAISIWGNHPENSIPVKAEKPIANELENLIQTRRSVRKFKKDEIDKSLINSLVNMASYAPTAKNENAVQFTVVDNRNDMTALRKLAYNYIKKASKEEKLPESFMFLENFQNIWEEKQIDVVFRNAPHLLITSAPKNSTLPQHDCTIASSYFELLANANGIGTLWNGFAKNIFEDATPEIKQELGIPANHEIGTVLVFGIPAVKFARSIQNEANIKTIALND